MEQSIQAPTEDDIGRIARQLIRAQALVEEATGRTLQDSLADLDLLQTVVDSGVLGPESTFDAQCVGVAFGRVLVAELDGFDWAVVEDEYGRDPALRYGDTTLLLFPLTMISKRTDDGERPDVRELYEGVSSHVAHIIANELPSASAED